MISRFLTIVTVLAMLWHSIGGCCWHHEHQKCESQADLVHSHSHAHHEHGTSHESEDGDSQEQSPCDHQSHCNGAACVYLKSCSPDVTGLFQTQPEYLTTAHELLAQQDITTLHPVDRLVLHREELSAREHCALTQSWLL